MAKMVFTGKDELSPVIKRISRNLDELGDKSSRVARKIGKIGAKQGFRAMSGGIDLITRSLENAAVGAGAFAASFVNINDQMEQLNIMLETATGSGAAADKAFKDIFNFAETAPFGIDTITDSFVKLKVAGIDPMNGTLRTLVDSVAAFGGTDEQLKLVTIAIRQMVGKGVISMEELRRQFGEQVPTAIKAMARGLGYTYDQLISEIETGNLEAMKGITAMLTELEKLHGGAARKRMESYRGAVTRLTNAWKILLFNVGDSGSFESITNSIGVVAEAIKEFSESAEGMRIIESISDEISVFFTDLAGHKEDISEIVSALGDMAIAGFEAFNALLENKDALIDLFTFLVEGTAKLSGIFGNLITSVKGFNEVTAGNLGFFDYATMNPEELDAWFEKHDSNINKAKGKLKELQAEYVVLLKKAQSGEIKFTDESLTKTKIQIDEITAKIDQLMTNMGGFEPSIDIDTEKFETRIKASGEKIKSSLALVGEAVEKSSEDAAAKLVENYDQAITAASERIETLGEKIKEQSQHIEDITGDFASDINETLQAGMSDEEVWRDQLRIIEEFKKKAATAYESGNVEKYVEYLEKAYDLTNKLSTAGIEEPFDKNKLKAAVREFERIDRITRGGKVAGGRDMYEDALRQVRKLQKARKEGTTTAVTAEEQIREKLRLQKDLQEKIMEAEKSKLDSMVAEKEKLETLKSKYEELKELVDARNTAVEHGGELIVNVAGKWYESFDGLNTRLQTVISNIQEMNSQLEKTGQLDLPTSFNGKAYAKGGRNYGRDPILVGENGPEIWTPPGSGTIVPNHKLGSMETVRIDFGMPDGSRAPIVATKDSVADFYKKTERYYRRAS